MLISHRHKFIFIHIYKNAGSSITFALRPFAETGWRFRMWKKLRCLGWDLRTFSPQPLPAHIMAGAAYRELGSRVWEDYFTFAFVRNPWEWQVSLYRYMLSQPSHRQHHVVKQLGSFSAYLQWRCGDPSHVVLQRSFIYEQESLLVKFVGRYESIETDFRAICGKVGISTELPKINVSNTDPYQQYYDRESKELVAKTYQEDLDTFGYVFDEP